LTTHVSIILQTASLVTDRVSSAIVGRASGRYSVTQVSEAIEDLRTLTERLWLSANGTLIPFNLFQNEQY